MQKVSVIIPAYNCSLYIRETLESILSQAVDGLEVIVVNDGSRDDTADIARSFGPPVTVIDQTNAGVCAARNRGIRHASGEFIALVDHDDFWLANKLQNQLAAFKANPQVDVVFSSFSWWHPNPATGKFELPESPSLSASPLDIDPTLSGWIYHRMLIDSYVLTSTALARAKVVKDANGFDEKLPFGEDWDFWLRISRSSQFLKLQEKSTLYRQHPTQGSRVLRSVDYRTQILENAVKQWGLCSPDGQCLPAKQFKRQLAQYSAEYGLGHLKGGAETGRQTAIKSFNKAFSIDPTYWRSLAYLAATRLGWKPNW
jgi:GT2 family glycosyltransferase